MKDENEKLKKLNSVNVTFHRDITQKLDSDLQSMTQARNELLQQIRVMNFQKNLDRGEFEKRLHTNQRTVVIHHNEEDNSFSHRLRQNLPNHNGENGNSRTGRQLANSRS